MKSKTILFIGGVLLMVVSLPEIRLRADNPPPDLIQGFRDVEVASVSDAIEQLYGKKAYMSHEMRPLLTTKFAGPAVTVELKKEENTEGTKAIQGMMDAIDEAGPGSVYVMVVDDGVDYAGLGGLMSTAMKYRGFAGAIVGSGQIMGTVEGWKRLVDIIKSPANGITFDCGVTREMGQNPVEVCRYFGERDCINHVHFRNVRVQAPYEKYTEVFIDEGQINMFAVMKELVRLNYGRTVYPEHPRALDGDRERPGFKTYYPGGGGYTGFAYNVGYAKAMLQAATVDA